MRSPEGFDNAPHIENAHRTHSPGIPTICLKKKLSSPIRGSFLDRVDFRTRVPRVTMETGSGPDPSGRRIGLGLGAIADSWVGGRVLVRRFAGPARHAEQLTGIRVAHLTDLHVGRMTPMSVQLEAVELTNRLEPDLVAITGDFVCHSQLHLSDLAAIIGRIRAPVLCVLGNHDYWSGAAEVKRVLEHAGAEVLQNAHTTISVRRQRLQIVGLDDAYTGHANMQRAVKGLRPDLATIALSHIAEEADGLWEAGIPLVLSGHTHAGHVTLARLHELAIGRIAGHRYIHGLYGSRDLGGSGAVYVAAGIGASVMPLRLGERARREVALFELGSAPGSVHESMEEQRPHAGRRLSARKEYHRAAAVVRKERKREARRRG